MKTLWTVSFVLLAGIAIYQTAIVGFCFSLIIAGSIFSIPAIKLYRLLCGY